MIVVRNTLASYSVSSVLRCNAIIAIFSVVAGHYDESAFPNFQILQVLVYKRKAFCISDCRPHDNALHIGVLCHSGDYHGFALIVSDGDAYYLAVVTIAVVYIAVAVFGLVELAVSVDERQRAVEQVFFGDGLPKCDSAPCTGWPRQRRGELRCRWCGCSVRGYIKDLGTMSELPPRCRKLPSASVMASARYVSIACSSVNPKYCSPLGMLEPSQMHMSWLVE